MNCIIVSYYFHEYEIANKWVEECEPLLHVLEGSYQLSLFVLFQSLVLLSLPTRCGDESEVLTIATENASKLRAWAVDSSETYLNKLSLLEAEMAVFKGDDSQAYSQFNKAVLFSKHYNFIHEEALANERAGLFYVQKSNTEKATYFLSQAYKAYLKWGANAKAEHLMMLFADLIETGEECDESSVDSNPLLELSLKRGSISSVSELSVRSNADTTATNEHPRKKPRIR